jgi:branched-chain amino acid transport system substrate-binding protein
MRGRSFRLVAALAGVVTATGMLATTAGARTHTAAKQTIYIGALGPFFDVTTGTKSTEWPAAVNARVKAMNAAHSLGKNVVVKVFECDTGLDPNQTEKCVRDAVAKGVVAAVGWNGTTGANLFPLLQQNGIAEIASVPVGLDEVNNPVSFPFTSGVPGAFEGLPIGLGSTGATKQALVITDLGAPAAAAVAFVQDSIKRQGYDLTSSVKAPPDQADFAPIVANATSGNPQGMNVFIIGQAAGTFIQTLRQSGYTGKLSSGSPFLTPKVISALGSNANGIIVTSLLKWQGSKNGKLFAADMKKYAKGQALTDLSANYWLGTWVFEQVAKQIVKSGGTVDAKSVLAAMGQLSNFDTGGMTPPISTTQAPAIASPLPLPRMFNPTVINFVIKNGKQQLVDGKFINPFEKQ